MGYVNRYCSECKTDTSEVIGAGEKLRLSKKKANMQSKKGDTTRDWGKVKYQPIKLVGILCYDNMTFYRNIAKWIFN
jgi:hypothetical protein